MTQVYNTRFNENEPLETQINTLLGCICTINSLSHPFNDHLADTQSTASTSDVKAHILHNKQHHIIESGSTVATFFAKAGKKLQRDNRHERTIEKPASSNTSKSCTHCKFSSHDILECRKLKHALKAARESESNLSAKLAITNREDNDSDSETTISSTETACTLLSISDWDNIGNQWILDSGAMCSMCSNRD